MAQSWLWGGQIAVKKKSSMYFYQRVQNMVLQYFEKKIHSQGCNLKFLKIFCNMNCVLFILLPATFYLLIGLQQKYQNCVFCALFPAIFCIYSFPDLLKRICCGIQQRNCVFCALFPVVFSIRLQVYIKVCYFSCNINQ